MNIDDSFYSLLNSAKHKDGSGLTSSERWTPKVKKSDFKLSDPCEKTLNDEVKSNLFYNFEYLEFLQFEYDSLVLTPVLRAMLVKNYIITGVSIIELCFHFHLSSYIDPNDLSHMSLENKINKEKENSSDYYNLTEEDFRTIHKLRKLRDHVHIYIRKKNSNSYVNKNKEYNMFSPDGDNPDAKKAMGDILFKLFGRKGSKFTKNNEAFNYLKTDK